MTRLSADQVEQGLLHADQNVRSDCLKYFTQRYGRDPTVTPPVIEAIGEAGKGESHIEHPRYEEGRLVVETMARQGDRHVAAMTEALGKSIGDYTVDPLGWIQPLMIRLAGELRHVPSLPLIISALNQDDVASPPRVRYQQRLIETHPRLQRKGNAMTSDNVALARRWFEVLWNERRPEIADELLTSESVCISEPGELRGVDEFKTRVFAPFISAFPDMKISVEGTVAEADQVVVRWIVHGTHTGPGLGMAPTGKAVHFKGMTWLRIRDGKLIEGWDCWNQERLMQSLRSEAGSA